MIVGIEAHGQTPDCSTIAATRYFFRGEVIESLALSNEILYRVRVVEAVSGLEGAREVVLAFPHWGRPEAIRDEFLFGFRGGIRRIREVWAWVHRLNPLWLSAASTFLWLGWLVAHH